MQYVIKGNYWGVNHAMPLSGAMQEKIGISYVPRLNVNYEIRMDIDRVNRHIDLVVYVTGDGFPNCEAFIVGPGGTAIFIGTHVRKGPAPITLALNLGYPMIASAIRIPIDINGRFTGTLADEMKRRSRKRRELQYQSIESWNRRFLEMSPNHNRCMFVEDFRLEGCFNR